MASKLAHGSLQGSDVLAAPDVLMSVPEDPEANGSVMFAF